MSKFDCLVVGDDPASLLEPFRLDDSGRWTAGAEFVDWEDDLAAERRRWLASLDPPDDCSGRRPPDPRSGPRPTFEEFIRSRWGEPDRRTGRYGAWRNPRGRWDYWFEDAAFFALVTLAGERTTRARRHDVEASASLHDAAPAPLALRPPRALLVGSDWHERRSTPLSASAADDAAADADWRVRFSVLWTAIPPDARVAALVCHA